MSAFSLPNLTQEDIYNRLLTQLPPWFGNRIFDDGSVFNIVLQAYIVTALEIYSQLQFIDSNLYLGQITDTDQLNLFAQDFFGNGLPRQPDENNYTYSQRILANIFNIKATRQGMFDNLLVLTGMPPLIIEPWNVLDTFLYGDSTDPNFPPSNWPLQHGAYGNGYYGSIFVGPYQAYIIVYLPNNQGLGGYPGYGLPQGGSPYPLGSLGGYGLGTNPDTLGALIYGSQTLITQIVTPEMVYQVINATKMEGTKIWVAIEYRNPEPPSPPDV